MIVGYCVLCPGWLKKYGVNSFGCICTACGCVSARYLFYYKENNKHEKKRIEL